MTATLSDSRTTSISFPRQLLDLLQAEATHNRVSLATIVRKYIELGLVAAAQGTEQDRSLGQVGLSVSSDDLNAILRM